MTKDPVLRFPTGGHATVDLSVAVNRRWHNAKTDEWEEAADEVALSLRWASGKVAKTERTSATAEASSAA